MFFKLPTAKAKTQLKELPEHITHVYARQHKTTGLQSPYEGPFKVDSRPSRSTVKIEVGTLKSGEKRFEIRHLNDLKVAHEDSLAAPIERPKLGRRPKADQQNKPIHLVDSDPKPTVDSGPKPTVQPAPEKESWSSNQTETTGPPKVPPFSGRPVRTTRNPTPLYVDAIWSASKSELAELNRRIGA